MKISLITLLLTMPLLVNMAYAQEARPIPPGIRQADKAEAQTERNIPPPLARRATIDPAKLKHDADELAGLAQTVAAQVDQTIKGVLPKDLSENLKRIEKVSKRLRSELNP